MAFLDFEKAFDRVSWNYRDQVMERVGFPPDKYFGRSVTQGNDQSLLNDRLTRPISQTRGFRQGCALPITILCYRCRAGGALDPLPGEGWGGAT